MAANAFSSFMNLTGRATADLSGGFGGPDLTDQLTEEEKRRRRLLQQQGNMAATDTGSILGGLSVPALFGNYGR